MKKAVLGWAWSQIDRRDSRFVSVLLRNKDQSVVLAFPKPIGWNGMRAVDQALVRRMLSEAANEPWEVPPPAA